MAAARLLAVLGGALGESPAAPPLAWQERRYHGSSSSRAVVPASGAARAALQRPCRAGAAAAAVRRPFPSRRPFSTAACPRPPTHPPCPNAPPPRRVTCPSPRAVAAQPAPTLPPGFQARWTTSQLRLLGGNGATSAWADSTSNPAFTATQGELHGWRREGGAAGGGRGRASQGAAGATPSPIATPTPLRPPSPSSQCPRRRSR